MLIHNIDPVAFNFFIFEIRWYSLAYIFGILLGWYYAKKIINRLIHSPLWNEQFSFLKLTKNVKPSFFGLPILINKKYLSRNGNFI